MPTDRCAVLEVCSPITFEVPGALRDIFSGAAPLDAEVQKECSELFNGHVVVRQGYGMTELSPVSHASPLVGQKYVREAHRGT